MKKTEAEYIIKNYKPHKGLYDLSDKPKSLTDIEYAKILDTQNLLARVKEYRRYYLENDMHNFKKAQRMSGELQQVIFTHWGNDVRVFVD